MKILIVGVGSIGKRHLRNLLFLGYKNITLVENNYSVIAEFGNKYKRYKSLDQAFKKDSFDVVFICSPTHLHLQHAQAALKHNCHVFIEKPLSGNIRGVAKLRTLARGKVVMVGCNWLFNKAFISFRNAVESNKWGKVLYLRIACGYFLPNARPGKDYKMIYAAQKNGGGVLLDTGSHVLNYLMYLFGNIKNISIVRNSINNLKIKSDEISHVLLEFSNKVTCDISMDYVSKRPINRIETITDRGLLTLDFVSNVLIFDEGKSRKTLFAEKIDLNQMYIDELEHYFRCIEKRQKPVQGIDDAEEVLKTIFKGGTQN